MPEYLAYVKGNAYNKKERITDILDLMNPEVAVSLAENQKGNFHSVTFPRARCEL